MHRLLLEVGSKEKHCFYEGRVSIGTVADTAFGHLRVWKESFYKLQHVVLGADVKYQVQQKSLLVTVLF